MPKQPLVLIGSRALMDFYTDTCEVLGIELLGFLDQYYWGNTESISGVPCIGSELDLIDNPKKYADAKFMIANTWDGNSRFENLEHDGYHLRQQRLAFVKQLDLPCYTLIDPRAIVAKNNQIGQGTYIGPLANIRSRNVIGEHVFIHDNAIMAHDVHVGENSILGVASVIMGGVRVGENVYVGSGALLVNGKSTKQPYITVGDDCKIHAGALVQKDMEAGTTATFVGKYLRRTDLS
jgi:acetyltransferase-like isoleucine patch superfamily enzyme